LQELLIKGLIPVAKIVGFVSEAIEGTSDMPDEKSSWEDLSSAVVLIAGANHELNMCRRDLFKADLEKDYKALCNNKHPVEGELFGEDLAERLKTVKETKKASKQLTKNHKGSSKRPEGRQNQSRGYFLFNHRGRSYRARPHRPYDTYQDNNQSKANYSSQSKGSKTAKQSQLLQNL